MVNKHDLCELYFAKEDLSSTEAMVKPIDSYNKQKDQVESSDGSNDSKK